MTMQDVSGGNSRERTSEGNGDFGVPSGEMGEDEHAALIKGGAVPTRRRKLCAYAMGMDITCLAQQAARQVTSGARLWWSWAGHCVNHVVWVVEGIERATSGGSGGGGKRKELMDSSLTMERAGSDWNNHNHNHHHPG
ncbi:hypothetical protein C8J57DRAFT_1226092 [Mycena rebaudengoi]|nr:hypothetical protein C8J57DRAFT_1226092 [Mycena rebaudengoi]